MNHNLLIMDKILGKIVEENVTLLSILWGWNLLDMVFMVTLKPVYREELLSVQPGTPTRLNFRVREKRKSQAEIDFVSPAETAILNSKDSKYIPLLLMRKAFF